MRNTNLSTYIVLMLGWCSKYSYKVGSSKLSIFLNSSGRDIKVGARVCSFCSREVDSLALCVDIIDATKNNKLN